jgi:divalent metal cation (Fe/Co/Zn/Cd) transporter
MVVTVDSGITAAEAHAITDAIEEELRAHLSIDDVTIHVEPDG